VKPSSNHKNLAAKKIARLRTLESHSSATEKTMDKKNTKQILFWTAMTALSGGTLIGCEYCIPAMFALLTGNYLYRAARTLSESLPTQHAFTQTGLIKNV